MAYEMRISDWISDLCSSDLEFDRSGHLRAGDRVVHAVERAQEGRLAAPRRADEGGDEVGADVDRHVVDRQLLAIEDADALRAHRSEERRVGTEGVRTCRSRWSP